MVAAVTSRPRRIVSGAGAIDAVRDELALLGASRALIVGGPHVLTGPVGAAVRNATGDRSAGTFDGCRANAPAPSVEALAERVRESRADALIAVGGGSAIDAAKGAAVLLGAGGPLADHATRFEPPDRLVVPNLDGPRLPIVAVPTTFAASDATASAGFIELGRRHKIVVVDQVSPVRCVLLDPLLAAHTPRSILAASVGNAVNHCVEAVYSRGHSPMTDAYALAALRTFAVSAGAALHGDLEALGACQAAAHLSGLAMPRAGLGVAHGLCHVLGVFGADHGAANSVVLPHAIRFNADHAPDRLALLANVLGGDPAERVTALLADLGAPTALREIGVNNDDLATIAAGALHDRHLYANPRPVSDAAELEQLLREAW